MTRDSFIKKWLGNPDYKYSEENRDAMRDDLDLVINSDRPVCEECGNTGVGKPTLQYPGGVDCSKCNLTIGVSNATDDVMHSTCCYNSNIITETFTFINEDDFSKVARVSRCVNCGAREMS